MDHPVIWRWLTQHPMFISAPDDEHCNMLYDVNPVIAHDQFEEVEALRPLTLCNCDCEVITAAMFGPWSAR